VEWTIPLLGTESLAKRAESIWQLISFPGNGKQKINGTSTRIAELKKKLRISELENPQILKGGEHLLRERQENLGSEAIINLQFQLRNV